MRIFLMMSLVIILSACGKKDSASVQLTFNHEPLLKAFGLNQYFGAIQSKPSTFQMKLIAAYLSEDIDPTTLNNTGMTGFFYLNPECNNDIMHCDISGGIAEDGEPMSQIIRSYFDFGQSSDDVNLALNAQKHSITAQSYKYVRLEFCKYNSENSKNIIWGTQATGSVELQRNECGVNSAVFDPPLELVKGDEITVTLSYSMEGKIQTGSDAKGDDCVGSGESRTCFTLPTFTPTANQ